MDNPIFKQEPLRSYIFKNVQGVWLDVAGDSAILADILTDLNITIDEHTQFARLYFYEENYCIWYRAYGGKITIDIWKIDPNKKCLRIF